MANFVFTAAREGFLTGAIDMDTATIRAAFVRGYTGNAAHVFVADVLAAGGVLNGAGVALTNRTTIGGVFDADDVAITTTASTVSHGILLYQSSSPGGGADLAAAAQRLVAWFDTGAGLPVQPGSGSTLITWPSGADKIFSITQS